MRHSIDDTKIQSVAIYIIKQELLFFFNTNIYEKIVKLHSNMICSAVCLSNNIITKFPSLLIPRKDLQIKTNVNSP